MKSNELMLNNSVVSKLHNGLITEIKEMAPNSVRLWANPFATYTYDDIDGVPLTNAILLKLNFTKHPTNSNETRGNYVDANKLFAIQYLQDCYFYDGRLSDIEIKYLHQLQNLYFALTGTELTVNI